MGVSSLPIDYRTIRDAVGDIPLTIISEEQAKSTLWTEKNVAVHLTL